MSRTRRTGSTPRANRLASPTSESNKSFFSHGRLTDVRSHPHVVPILLKWAGRIQAATAAQAGGKVKFIQTSQTSIFDAIDAGLASKVSNLAFATGFS